ncbi:hypothetical protein NKI36_14860 [Mesorhizobium caraganae]|uniref:DUF768 domain-containing protein n=1 Tax=Mesorhizobium caraganae TaxID=483206 RepID=A0ABV1YZY4_9HYPH
MSARGINFLDKWMAEHLPNVITDDPGAITDLADQAMKAAEKEGISANEISDEVGSVFEVILEAMKNRAGGEGE